MDLSITVHHTKTTQKARTYEGRAEGVRVTVEIPPEHFAGPIPADLVVEVKPTH